MGVCKNQSQRIKARLVTSCLKNNKPRSCFQVGVSLGEKSRVSWISSYDFFITCQRLAASVQLMSNTAGRRRNISSVSGEGGPSRESRDASDVAGKFFFCGHLYCTSFRNKHSNTHVPVYVTLYLNPNFQVEVVYLPNNREKKRGSLKRHFGRENGFLVADQDCKWVPCRPKVHCLQFQTNYRTYCSRI